MHVAIIGNGITGISAALRLRELRPDWRISLISGESAFHYSRPALMYVFMGDLSFQDTKPYPDSFWREQRLDLHCDRVTAIDFAAKRLLLQEHESLSYDRLLLATGSRSNRFGWPGQELRGVQGLYGLNDLTTLTEDCQVARRAVIVGGGLIGIELAEMLHWRGLELTLLVREPHYWGNVLPAAEGQLVERRIRQRGIELRTNTQLAAILDDGTGRVGAVTTDAGDRIDCELVGLTAGVSPNLELVRGTALRTARGIVVDRQMRTSLPGVFAAGDCAEIVDATGASLVQQVWYTGRMQGLAAAEAIAGQGRDYDPGIWYNSAKFFDLEYQTYGQVLPEIGETDSLYWQDERGDRALRIAHADGHVVGFNFLGIRARHRECERWIREAATVERVLAELPRAHFDSEFQTHAKSLQRVLTAQWAEGAAR